MTTLQHCLQPCNSNYTTMSSSVTQDQTASKSSELHVSDANRGQTVSDVLQPGGVQTQQVAQLSQRNRTATWISFGWVVDDGVGQ